MKKFFNKLLLLLGVLLSLGTTNSIAAYQDKIYVRGDLNGWGATPMYHQYTNGTEEVYVAFFESFPQGNFKLSGSSTGWDDYNYGSGNDLSGGGTNMYYNGGNTNWKGSTSNIRLTFYHKGYHSQSWLEADPIPNLYIYSDYGNTNWDLNKRIQMTRSGEVYTGTIEITSTSANVIFSEKSSNYWDGDGGVNEKRYVPNGGNNFSPNFNNNNYSGNIQGGKNGTYVLEKGKYIISLNLPKGEITITKDEPVYPDLYLVGDDINGGSSWEKDNKMTFNESNNTYTWKGTRLGSNFKINDGDWEQPYNIGQKDKDGYLSLNTPYDVIDSKDSQNIKLAENTYISNPTVTFDIDKMTVTVTGTEVTEKIYPENLYVIGYVDGNSFNPTKGYQLTPESEGVFSGVVNFTSEKTDINNNNSYFSFATQLSNNSNDWDGLGTRYGAPSKDLSVHVGSYDLGTDGNNSYMISPGTYYVKVDLTNMDITLYPTSMYVYGHLNDLAWEINNYEPMVAGATPGVFTAKNVEISGRWNKHDADGNDSRDEFGSTEDENYITFYDHLISNQENFDKVPKYSTTDSSNEEIDENHKVANLKYGENNNNFHVPEGFYNITVDLTNMTVTFEKFEKTDVVFTWYQGGHDGQETSVLADQNEHGFTFGDGTPDILQVGIGTNPTHRVARMVEYTVWYKAPGATSSAKAIKRYAGENQTDYEVLGYEEATPSTTDEDGNITELGDYTIIGSSAYGDNHLIQLNKAGDYAIIASINTSKDERLAEYNDVPDNTLLVSVAQAEADVTFSPYNSSVPFPVKEAATLEGALEFEQELVLAKDFTISIKAKNDAAGWAVPNNAEDLDASYQAQLTENLYSQYEELGENIKVDGFYIKGQETVTANSKDNYSYDVLVNVPCSGVYEVTVAPVANGNYKFDAITTDISIYPNLQAKFGKDYGFNIDRYMFADDDAAKEGKIEFPTEKFDYHIREAFIPGSYFVNHFSTEENSVKAMSVTPDNYRENYSDQCYVDLGDDFTNSGENGKNVEIYVAKNGASNKYIFTVVPTTGNGNVSTGVEGIVAEDGEATYYTLQGVKVDNPEKGIYIKVVNGKASKVLVK